MNVITPEKAFQLLGRKDLLTKQASEGGDYSFEDRNATLRSYVIAYVKQAGEYVLHECADYARFWGNIAECEEAVTKLAAYEEPKLEVQDFALVQGDLHKFAAFDASSTFDSAIAFIKQRPIFPLAWRKEAATRLLARGQQHQVTFPEYVNCELHKSAGLGYPTSESLEDAMICRMNNCKDNKIQAKLAALLEPLIDNPVLRHDFDMVKIATEALEVFDAGLGLTDQYGSEVDLPEAIIHDTTNNLEKLADCAKVAVELVNGKTVNVEELSKEALSAVDPNLAKLAQSELIDVLPTLPRGDADLLARLA